MFKGLAAILSRELRLAVRQGGDTVLVLGFFVITVVLFPFGVGPEPQILARISAGIIWVCALLAALLSLDRLFHADHEDGSLDLLLLAPMPTSSLVFGKCLAHWLTTGLPLVAASPLLALMFNLEIQAYGVLILSLLLGTPILSLIGAAGAALTLGARRGGVLLSLLVLPLYIPALIFGIAAVEASVTGMSVRPHLMLLGALLLFALALTPFVAASALRQAAEA
ncbi:MAG: heme exporter protein CcmB [Alphaproteobacteria bacterium]